MYFLGHLAYDVTQISDSLTIIQAPAKLQDQGPVRRTACLFTPSLCWHQIIPLSNRDKCRWTTDYGHVQQCSGWNWTHNLGNASPTP